MPDANRSHSPAPRSPRPSLPFDGFGPEEYELVAVEVEPVAEPVLEGRRAAVRGFALRAWPRAAWLGLAAILALGSAGVVTAMSRPGPDSRHELTYAADRELRQRLDAAAVELEALSGQVEGLGDQARLLLGNLTQIDKAGLEAAYASGDAALGEIERLAGKLGDEMDCDGFTAERTRELRLAHGGTLVDDWLRLCRSLESVRPLAADWDAMVDGSKVAMGVVDAIAEHDRLAAEALELATQGRYPEALGKIDEADNALEGARQLAAGLARVGRDVSTLSEWLERIGVVDAALETLWREMIVSGGRITAQVTAALKAVTEAQALLPVSSTVLSVVLYELAGYLLGEGISIEQARGQLGAALAALTAQSASTAPPVAPAG